MQNNVKIKSLIFQIQTIIFCPEWADLRFLSIKHSDTLTFYWDIKIWTKSLVLKICWKQSINLDE